MPNIVEEISSRANDVDSPQISLDDTTSIARYRTAIAI
jgi:hypothetical protein